MSAVVITGIRDLDSRDHDVVYAALADLTAQHPEEIIFGGARGTDTVALEAAAQVCPLMVDRRPRRVVIVPGTVAKQPSLARIAIRAYAHEVEELGLSLEDWASFSKRNARMLDRALKKPPARLVAFHDGKRGGTANCIDYARLRGIPVQIVQVRRT